MAVAAAAAHPAPLRLVFGTLSCPTPAAPHAARVTPRPWEYVG